MKWWLKLVITGVLWTSYAAAYNGLTPLAPYLVGLILIPTLITAWYWGSTAGVLVSLFAFELIAALFTSATQLTSWQQLASERGMTNIVLHAFLALSFGYFGNIQRQLSAQKRLTQQAQFDELTGLLTRAAFEGQFEAAIKEARQTDSSVALLFIDLDRFKFVNDTYGHDMGDELLKAVAGCLTRSIRQNDLAARLGGDEFILALRGLKETRSAATVAADIVKLLSSPFEIRGKVLRVSASVGISIFPQDGEDVETLTRNADTAMYQTKAAGKNDYSFSTKQVQAQQSRRLKLEHHLRLALGDSQLKVHYQPQINLQNGQLAGFEALLRWEHPELGDISPSELIPLAEEAGLILPVGHWLLREACMQARHWQRSGFAPVKIAVNVSTLQFSQPDFVGTVGRALRDSGLPPECLEVEITESLLMKDLSLAAQTLQKLRDLGVETALDDFGTGHSSLLYLQRLPIQSLKIDRSFMDISSGSPSQESNAVIIEAICGLARKLSKSVVAEGVETREQRDYLRKLGCHYAQGYLFSKPLTHTQAESFLLEEALREEKRSAQVSVQVQARAQSQERAKPLPLGD